MPWGGGCLQAKVSRAFQLCQPHSLRPPLAHCSCGGRGGGGTGNSSLAAWNLSDSAGVLLHQTHTEELEEDIILWEEAIMWFGAKIMQLGR